MEKLSGNSLKGAGNQNLSSSRGWGRKEGQSGGAETEQTSASTVLVGLLEEGKAAGFHLLGGPWVALTAVPMKRGRWCRRTGQWVVRSSAGASRSLGGRKRRRPEGLGRPEGFGVAVGGISLRMRQTSQPWW